MYHMCMYIHLIVMHMQSSFDAASKIRSTFLTVSATKDTRSLPYISRSLAQKREQESER